MSRIPNIRRIVASMRWAMLPEKLEAMIEILEARAALGHRFSDEEMRERLAGIPLVTRSAGQARPIKGKGGMVAVLPLTGIIAPKASMVNGPSLPEGTACETFAAAFDQAMADDEISHIVIDVDSPGGSVDGVPELAARIFGARGKKPITAVANSMAASAAYWIASAADEIVVAPSGEVGSIGVYLVHFDFSEQLAQDGVSPTIIKAGDYKAEGNPLEPLSDEAKAYAQEQIDEFYSMFVGAVAKHRNVSKQTVLKDYGQGRMLLARNAVAAGMANRIGTLESVLAKLGISNTAYLAARRGQQQAEAPALERAAGSGDERDELERAAESVQEFEITASLPDMTRVRATFSRPPSLVASPAAGGAAPVTLLSNRESQPAPKGQEQTVPDEQAPAPPGGAATTDIVLAERRRAKEIRQLCADHNVDDATFAEGLIDRGASVDEASREILALKRAQTRTGPVIRGVHDREVGKPWTNFGEQVAAIIEAYSPGGRTDKRLAAASGMNQAVPSEGGFAVAPQFAQTIWDGMHKDPDALLPMTDNYTVEQESLTFLANAETSRATGSRYGGIKGYWINEADQITKSKPKLRQVKIEPQQLAVLVYLTEKLIRNSPVALEQFVTRAATEEINFLVGDAIINGTGAGQPKGILAAPCVVSITKETSQPNTTVQQENISKMWARLHPQSRRNAVWLHNPDVEPQFDFLNTVVKTVAGTENVGGYANKVWDAEKRTLKGRPAIPCEFLPTLGTPGDLLLADLSAYVTGTRGGIQSAMSMHVRFEFAEQALRFMFEADGQPWLASAITPYKGSNTLTTFLTITQR